jgi:rifampicin phosphotransferase
VGFLDGRIYYRLDAWHALHGQLPAFELVRPMWEQAMGVAGEARQPRRWSKARAALALPRLLTLAVRHPRQVRRFLAWWDDLYERAGDLTDRTPQELVGFYRWLWAQVSIRWGVTLTNSVHALLLTGLTVALARRWTGDDHGTLAGLLVGGRENRSLATVRATIALAERINTVPDLADAVLRVGRPGAADARHVWDDLVRGHYGRPLAAAATDHVRRYGDRALHDLKLEEATPRQRPWMVLDTVRPFVRQGLTVATNRSAEQEAFAQARATLKRACPNPIRRGVLRVLAAAVRASVRVREDTRFCRTQLYGLSRQVMWRLGEALAAADLLDDPADVRDLTVHEVLGAFDGTLPGTDLRGLVAHRHAERARYTAAPPRRSLVATRPDLPFTVALRGAAPVADPGADPDPGLGATAGSGSGPGADSGAPVGDVLRGLGSSGGVIRGRARVVLEPTVDAASCQDTILVARETDPGWLFLMMAARGLVVERGTLLSHTAITGRLLGVPTVVGVHGATARIVDGAWIEIDGTTGTVLLLEETR